MLKSFWSKYQQRYTDTKSLLCVGLDPEFSRLPACVLESENPIWEFNRQIIDATYEYALAYKPNLAFYLTDGMRGLDALFLTMEHIPADIPVILDCKVGDIGSTMQAYVNAFFDNMVVDAITINPLMGADVMQPVLEQANAFAFALCLTSNPSAVDFLKYIETGDRRMAYPSSLAAKIASWMQAYPNEKLGAVIGATQSSELKDMRALLPGRILLVPGVGAQGGDLDAVLKDAIDTPEHPNIIINSSRGIIFAGEGKGFATKAAMAAKKLVEHCHKALS
ncbi:MAG: orotidine-5'-phosphate decarboxylase [Candidatus Cloacimonetes bacterium]|nr:orotidine-5'-phosphate decarboxylase [Candidatus Cloacimonadota bacterium]